MTLTQNRAAHQAEAHRQINDLYSRLMQFRIDHPEVLRLSREWTPAGFEAIYKQDTPEDRELALYYTYVELCTGFCNEVLHSRARNYLDKAAFDQHYKPLVKLLLTEHYRIIKDLVAGGKYISGYIQRFWQELPEREGWDWERNHRALAMADEPPTGGEN